MAQSNTYSNAIQEHKESEARGEVERLAAQQGVTPIADLDELRGDFWPEDEAIDDFINITRERRHIESAQEHA